MLDTAALTDIRRLETSGRARRRRRRSNARPPRCARRADWLEAQSRAMRTRAHRRSNGRARSSYARARSDSVHCDRMRGQRFGQALILISIRPRGRPRRAPQETAEPADNEHYQAARRARDRVRQQRPSRRAAHAAPQRPRAIVPAAVRGERPVRRSGRAPPRDRRVGDRGGQDLRRAGGAQRKRRDRAVVAGVAGGAWARARGWPCAAPITRPSRAGGPRSIPAGERRDFRSLAPTLELRTGAARQRRARRRRPVTAGWCSSPIATSTSTARPRASTCAGCYDTEGGADWEARAGAALEYRRFGGPAQVGNCPPDGLPCPGPRRAPTTS